MKKIKVNFTINVGSHPVSAEMIENYLSKFGQREFGSFVTEINLIANEVVETMQKERIILITSDESEPYMLVDRVGSFKGNEVDPDLLSTLQTGVCVSMHVEYPNSEKYGVPTYASEDSTAEAFVAEHGFSIRESGLSLSCNDSRDDSSDNVWLTIKSIS